MKIKLSEKEKIAIISAIRDVVITIIKAASGAQKGV